MLALFPAKMKIYLKICDLFQSNDEKAVIEICLLQPFLSVVNVCLNRNTVNCIFSVGAWYVEGTKSGENWKIEYVVINSSHDVSLSIFLDVIIFLFCDLPWNQNGGVLRIMSNIFVGAHALLGTCYSVI